MEQQRARWPAFKFCNIVNTCLVVLYKLWEQKCKCTQTDLHTHHQNYFYSMYDVGGYKSCELISFTWNTTVGSLCMKRICFRIHNWNETFSWAYQLLTCAQSWSPSEQGVYFYDRSIGGWPQASTLVRDMKLGYWGITNFSVEITGEMIAWTKLCLQNWNLVYSIEHKGSPKNPISQTLGSRFNKSFLQTLTFLLVASLSMLIWLIEEGMKDWEFQRTFFFIYRNYVDETNKARKPCVSNPKFLIWQELPPNASIFVGGIPIDVHMTHRRRQERLRVLEESF
jgi:hypothetical protein